ncbi:hypothetical protein CDD82_411 [Ophiocordyceps australis]|uniref:Uncharacterized protein n=1 Tax=Ophiocordyceps australis TaxID=1399860 RepID=A0A2C5YGG2_9HYPO|nr:hypothetical protein CDD82_411 [Ophiocordyceps australis]
MQCAVRFMAGTSCRTGCLRLQLHVKPRASKNRQGILSVTHHIELCVSAHARDGQANKAVVQLLSDTTGLPKSRFSLVQGLRSRDKTAVLHNVPNDEGTGFAHHIHELLCTASRP